MTLTVSWVSRLKTQILSSHISSQWETKQVTELSSFISSTFPWASLKINRGMLLGVYYWKLPKSPPVSLPQKGPCHCWNLKASFASPRLTSVVTLGWRLTPADGSYMKGALIDLSALFAPKLPTLSDLIRVTAVLLATCHAKLVSY